MNANFQILFLYKTVVRVQSCGHVVVKMEVITKDLAQLGYVTSDKVYDHDE